jgi:N-acetylglucosaminyldiphosphoundecaprenol N-acetyl-beta-D-mannosaminyltransferase
MVDNSSPLNVAPSATDNRLGFREFDWFGLRLHNVTRDSLLKYVDSVLQDKIPRVIFGYSLTIIPKLKNDPHLAGLSNSFDVLLPEGKGIFLLANLFGADFQEHVSLPDAVEQLLLHSNTRKYSIFLLGATKEINAKARENIRRQYPQLAAVQGLDGYFGERDEMRVFETIRKADPDLILVGISSPMKERIATRLRASIQRGVIIPCGGVIDILGGKVKREPAIVKKLGVTWLFRFVQEPRRLFRPVLMNGIYFMAILFPLAIWKKLVMRDKSFTFVRPANGQ